MAVGWRNEVHVANSTYPSRGQKQFSVVSKNKQGKQAPTSEKEGSHLPVLRRAGSSVCVGPSALPVNVERSCRMRTYSYVLAESCSQLCTYRMYCTVRVTARVGLATRGSMRIRV